MSTDTQHPPRPKISVVMTTFERVEYIDDAIRSILTQTFRDFELIVWDDGSADRRVVELLEKFASSDGINLNFF